MILSFAKLIAKWFGVDLQKAQTGVIIVLMIVIGVGVLIFALWMRSCLNKPEPLNEAEVLKAQQAIKDGNDAELREVLVAVETREKAIEANVANAGAHSANAEAATVNAIHEARKKWANANISEMQAEIDRRHP